MKYRKLLFVGFAAACFLFLMAFNNPTNLKEGINNNNKLDSLLTVKIKKLDQPEFLLNLKKNATSDEQKKVLLSDVEEILYLQYKLKRISFQGTRMTLQDRINSFPDNATDAKKFYKELNKYEEKVKASTAGIYRNDEKAIEEINSFLNLHRSVLLNNPLLKDKEILVIRQKVTNARKAMAAQIGRNKNNWTCNIEIERNGWQNDICRLSNIQNRVQVTPVVTSENGYPLKDMDLNWDGNRLMYSSIGENNRWHIYEYNLNSGTNKRLTPTGYDDLDFFGSCYLPGGKIIMSSTASYIAVPCVAGNNRAASLYLLNPDNQNIRQLTFGQETEWDPVVLHNGKVCYLRWEYTDNSHYFTRILMNMNPDGTTKKAYYGSGSYFPNSLYDVRPVPGHSSQFVGVISGHHGVARSGRLLVFDPVQGRTEADGVVQEIPGYGKKVEPIIKDKLVNGVWPQFLTPYPLNTDYFLVTAKMNPDELWGIYLVDKYDNMTLIHEHEGEAFTEPIVLEKRKTPPQIPERVNLTDTTSTVYIMDIYEGMGLKDVPKGTIKDLRIYAYEYSFYKAGNHDYHGIESGWDVKRLLGTVPVEEDGSATFKIPANTPVALHPLDENGSAMQLMRSWMSGMPGEVVSCVGCHESQNSVPQAKFTIASRKKPETVKSWYGETRPFSYNNEIKPVIDRKCVACHNSDADNIPDFSSNKKDGYRTFTKSYVALHPYVRRPGFESDFLTLEPMDYYSNTSDLIQILSKGHHGVELDKEEWDRLFTWIDMNVPFSAKYDPSELDGINQYERRKELMKRFANVEITSDTELLRANEKRIPEKIIPVMPDKKEVKTEPLQLQAWPFSKETALKMQKEASAGGMITKKVDIGEGIVLEFVRIPAGNYIMGDYEGQPDQTEKVVEIQEPFWMLKTEVTNNVFRTVFKDHDSRFIDQQWKDHVFAGYPANEDQMPVIRVTWLQAKEFCEKLSNKTGLKIDLPTEEQWEWAARAGSDADMYFGSVNDDFSKYENLADETIKKLAVSGVNPKPMSENHKFFKFYDFVPKEAKYNDGVLVPQGTAQYLPNAWGLYDMLGNVSEWTRSDYTHTLQGLTANNGKLKTAKGGSWRDRPKYATAASKDGYLPYQKVFNVGFRLIIEE